VLSKDQFYPFGHAPGTITVVERENQVPPSAQTNVLGQLGNFEASSFADMGHD
jgi:hypothetical protein